MVLPLQPCCVHYNCGPGWLILAYVAI